MKGNRVVVWTVAYITRRPCPGTQRQDLVREYPGERITDSRYVVFAHHYRTRWSARTDAIRLASTGLVETDYV